MVGGVFNFVPCAFISIFFNVYMYSTLKSPAIPPGVPKVHFGKQKASCGRAAQDPNPEDPDSMLGAAQGGVLAFGGEDPRRVHLLWES